MLLSAVNSTAAQLRCGTVGHGQGLDSRGAVEAAVLLEHRLDLSSDNSVLSRPLPLRLLPPGVVPAAGHAQLPAQPAHGEAIHWSWIRQNLLATAALLQSALPPA